MDWLSCTHTHNHAPTMKTPVLITTQTHTHPADILSVIHELGGWVSPHHSGESKLGAGLETVVVIDSGFHAS